MVQGRKLQKILKNKANRSPINRPAAIPKKPAINPNITYINLSTLSVKPREKSGIEKEEIAVIATIIIKIGLTRFALTAASPKY